MTKRYILFAGVNGAGKTTLYQANPQLRDDMVFGPMANDAVYTALTLYEAGLLTKEETIKRLKVRKLYDQILFHTKVSLMKCCYLESKEV